MPRGSGEETSRNPRLPLSSFQKAENRSLQSAEWR
jgi:hypothetical protein